MADFSGRIRRIRMKERINGSNYKMVVVVGGDTNDQVSVVEIQFNEPISGPTPNPSAFKCELKSRNKEKQVARFVYTELTFKGGDPLERTYNITATMKDASGNVLGEPEKMDVVVEENDNDGGGELKFTGRIRRIRMKERINGSNYKAIAVVGGDFEDQVASVKIQFDKVISGPQPTQDAISAPFKNKPISRYVDNTLTFEGDALEGKYQVTASMLDQDGKLLGETLTEIVTVEETVDDSDSDTDPTI